MQAQLVINESCGSTAVPCDSLAWRAWRAGDAALPPPPGHRCHWTHTKYGHMCLYGLGSDLMSDSLRRAGSWFECGPLLHLLNKVPRGSSRSFLELGANIGACTLPMLLANASIVAFEPSPANLFYLTSTLSEAVREYPELTGRAIVYPLAASSTSSTMKLAIKRHNGGHAFLRESNATQNPRDSSTVYQKNVPVRALDNILPDSFRADVLKIDVEGHECHTVRGMKRWLQEGRVGVAKVEFYGHLLRGADCSPTQLKELFADCGFKVPVHTPPCVEHNFGCDLILPWIGTLEGNASRSPWKIGVCSGVRGHTFNCDS